MPHASIGSDVIVGFPGESDDRLRRDRALLTELPLTHLHVFPYSDRPGTDASAMQRQGRRRDDPRTRAARARDWCTRCRTRFRQSQLGMVRRALTVDDGWSAVTDNYLKVRLAETVPRNEWIDARID